MLVIRESVATGYATLHDLTSCCTVALHTTDSADTLVMQNLGYFQLQANPGVWQLQLAPGRASELYHILPPAAGAEEGGLVWRQRKRRITQNTDEELDGEAQQGVTARPIVVRDFTGLITQLQVKKNPGQEGEQLLAPSDAAQAATKKQEGVRMSLGWMQSPLALVFTFMLAIPRRARCGQGCATLSPASRTRVALPSGRWQARRRMTQSTSFRWLLGTCTSDSCAS